jgi:hypothetical protein
MKICKFIKHWYEGKAVRDDLDEPDTIGGMGVLHSSHKEYHWTAIFAKKLVDFYFKYWQWLWGLTFALLLKLI